MDGEKGIVVNRLDDGYVRVKIKRSQACAHCKMCTPAGGNSAEDMLVDAINAQDASEGDEVNVSLRPQNLLKAIFIMYMIPCALMVAGFVLGNALAGELLGFVAGVFLSGLVYLCIRRVEKRGGFLDYVPTAHKL